MQSITAISRSRISASAATTSHVAKNCTTDKTEKGYGLCLWSMTSTKRTPTKTAESIPARGCILRSLVDGSRSGVRALGRTGKDRHVAGDVVRALILTETTSE